MEKKRWKMKKKWRLEYWESGRKYVKVFGSQAQANHFIAGLSDHCHGFELRSFLEREEKI